MNALTFGFKTQSPPVRRVVDAVRAFAGHPYISAPGRAQCFDCVALVTALTGYGISPDWVHFGGRLPFAPVPLEAAVPGDLLVLKDQDHWLMAVMTEGLSLDDPRARLFTVRRCRAAAEMWLTPALKDSLVSAYRLPMEG
jgi:hypothetical protein